MESSTPGWPYPVNYGRENEVTTDILIIGGGIAGCHAAISAAKRGAKVVIIDKGPVIRSGHGGAGVDHWHGACTNPCSQITPDELIDTYQGCRSGLATGEYGSGAATYILFRESYDALLDMERMGMKIRDVDDEFAGAEFRDEDTKLLFAYDYENKFVLRVQGATVKPALYKECKRLGVEICDRIMVTGLLTEKGKPGARVIGATGLNVRTGEFYIFSSKATIISTGPTSGLWVFSTELKGLAAVSGEPNCAGDGNAIAWKAGAEFTLMDASMPSSGGFSYPQYGTGNAHNTWFACSIVDDRGREIPWVDRDGNRLNTVSERYRPAPGQRVFYHGPPPFTYELQGPRLIPDLAERIKKGEYVLPFYADLPGMPAHERNAIFRLMAAHEGKTRIPIYEYYTRAGFDPDRDMLQANVLPPDAAGQYGPWWLGMGPPQWRQMAFGGGGGVV
ncbi:MAG: FAD-binding protein, partial [Deltaproteobacteria bacterium]|nr:FAD-binding protein [Deltaproteobacteria bacterium]